MILEYSKKDFIEEFVFSSKRIEIFEKLEEQIQILEKICFGYQTLIVGSFIKKDNSISNGYKIEPDDIDLLLRAYIKEDISETLEKHKRNYRPILPFTDFDKLVDIFPIEPIICEDIEFVSYDDLLNLFNKKNKFNTEEAIKVIEFQKI